MTPTPARRPSNRAMVITGTVAGALFGIFAAVSSGQPLWLAISIATGAGLGAGVRRPTDDEHAGTPRY